jgi:hypothetical protein
MHQFTEGPVQTYNDRPVAPAADTGVGAYCARSISSVNIPLPKILVFSSPEVFSCLSGRSIGKRGA